MPHAKAEWAYSLVTLHSLAALLYGRIFEGKEGKKKEKANEKQILSIVEIIILSYNKSSNYFLVCIVEEEFAIIIAKVTNL